MSDMATGHNEAVELQLRPSAAPSEPMVDDKSDAEARTSSSEASLEDQQDEPTVTKSTQNDVGDMRRMGKNQQLVRHFRKLSVTSFGVLATAAWEIGLFLLSPGLINGGRAGLVWNYLWNFVGFAPIYLSLAEMASMAPIAGVQYHWVSEFAPESCQRIELPHRSGNALGIFIVGSLAQTISIVNDEEYLAPAWQCTLLAIGAVVLAYSGNVFGAKILPYWQNAIFGVHVFAYFAFIVPIWVSAQTATHHQVWCEFSNSGGFSSIGLSVLVGQLTGISGQIGVDTAAHMSEEVKDAAKSVPQAMLTIYVVNFVLLFPGILTVVYHIPVLEDALSDPTRYPVVYVLRQALSSRWVTAMLAIILLLDMASNIAYLAAVTRDLFAFARDRGLPFSSWLSELHPSRKIPVNACIFSSCIAVLLSMIYIGSPLAFYAITSLLTVALLQCYAVSIGCVLWRRIAHPETLPPAKFSLGKYGVLVNSLAVIYSIWAFFWAFWPQEYPITAAGYNWASPIFFATLIVAMVFFVFKGRHQYFGPVVAVAGRNVVPRH